MTNIQFNHLSPITARHGTLDADSKYVIRLWQNFYTNAQIRADIAKLTAHFNSALWSHYRQSWQQLTHTTLQQEFCNTANASEDLETALTDWLIGLFNDLFNQANFTAMPTVLVRGEHEPEYFPAHDDKPARIEFAHGFFQSALHEISHWCVAGQARRKLNDFGYWYKADGRDQESQALFEQVEIKPQAIECLLSLACGRFFYVSQDNLNADFDTSASTFAADVFAKAYAFLEMPNTLPRDAKRLLWVLLALCQPSYYNDNEQLSCQ